MSWPEHLLKEIRLRVCAPFFFFILVHAKREKVLYRRLQSLLQKVAREFRDIMQNPTLNRDHLLQRERRRLRTIRMHPRHRLLKPSARLR